MPVCLRLEENTWRTGLLFEEEVEWCRVFVAFESDLLAGGDEHAAKCIREGHHTDTLRDCYPDAYEAHFGVTLLPGQSRAKDERAFYAGHADDLIVTAAWGDWHANVPEGMVGVVARLGRNRHRAVESGERYFLVAEDEYEARGRFGFVIDLTRHREIERFS